MDRDLVTKEVSSIIDNAKAANLNINIDMLVTEIINALQNAKKEDEKLKDGATWDGAKCGAKYGGGVGGVASGGLAWWYGFAAFPIAGFAVLGGLLGAGVGYGGGHYVGSNMSQYIIDRVQRETIHSMTRLAIAEARVQQRNNNQAAAPASSSVSQAGNRNGFFSQASSFAAASAQQAVAVNEIPNEYICPITQEIMQDPVVAADGRSYERVALQNWYNGGNRVCPIDRTKRLTNPADLPTNINLRNQIRDYQERQEPSAVLRAA